MANEMTEYLTSLGVNRRNMMFLSSVTCSKLINDYFDNCIRDFISPFYEIEISLEYNNISKLSLDFRVNDEYSIAKNINKFLELCEMFDEYSIYHKQLDGIYERYDMELGNRDLYNLETYSQYIQNRNHEMMKRLNNDLEYLKIKRLKKETYDQIQIYMNKYGFYIYSIDYYDYDNGEVSAELRINDVIK